MELNRYQEDSLDRFVRWQTVLTEQRKKSEELIAALIEMGQEVEDADNYPKNAWKAMAGKNDVAGGYHVDRRDKANRPIPHTCLKIPTGGGKTLLAAAVLERLNMRNGLVIWVVPTKKIYAQTRAVLRNRDSHIRQRLEHGSGGRVKFLEKDSELGMNDIEQHLCVMLLSLAAVNRQNNRDFLLINRNSGNYGTFFPDADDSSGDAHILNAHPDLVCNPDGTVMRSLANVFKMSRPVVVLDEAHKAYGKVGQEYAGMISVMDPSLVIEMSATPHPDISNLLVDVSGLDLWKEEMIKMPINLYAQTDPDWKDILGTVHARLGQLEGATDSLRFTTGRYVRPIALVRVERTGKNQRDGQYVHAEDVRDYLTIRLGVPPEHVTVQSSTQKELDGIDLLSEATQIRWIITKDAIKEGWDCPFAYVLAILDNIKTHTSVTQLLGRVLRQPGANRTGIDSLDQCYVYCRSTDTTKVVEYVKRGLSEAGMGDMIPLISTGGVKNVAQIEKKQKSYGQIFLPLVLHKDGEGWTELEYERHVLPGVDFASIRAPKPSEFTAVKQRWLSMQINPDGSVSADSEWEAHSFKTAGVVDFTRPLSEIIPNVWQAARIAQEFLAGLRKSGKTEADIYNAMSYLMKVLRDHVTGAVNEQAEKIFKQKIMDKDIRFNLEISDGNYRVKKYTVNEGTLLAVNGEPVQHSLFDPVYQEEFDTDLERCFARFLDVDETVHWWHRVAARQREGYHLSGWQKNNIYPDFITMHNKAGSEVRMGIYDTKAEYLKNSDTKYKEAVLDTLEDAFNCGTVTVKGSRLRGRFKLVFDNRFEEAL